MRKLPVLATVCCALFASCERPADAPATGTGSSIDDSPAERNGTTVATVTLKPGEASDFYRIESTEPVWIGYDVLAGLSEAEMPDSGSREVVEIERRGEVEPGNVGGMTSTALSAATQFIPQSGFVEVRVRNLTDRELTIRLYTDT